MFFMYSEHHHKLKPLSGCRMQPSKLVGVAVSECRGDIIPNFRVWVS